MRPIAQGLGLCTNPLLDGHGSGRYTDFCLMFEHISCELDIYITYCMSRVMNIGCMCIHIDVSMYTHI